jgi:hypothetical protein
MIYLKSYMKWLVRLLLTLMILVLALLVTAAERVTYGPFALYTGDTMTRELHFRPDGTTPSETHTLLLIVEKGCELNAYVKDGGDHAGDIWGATILEIDVEEGTDRDLVVTGFQRGELSYRAQASTEGVKNQVQWSPPARLEIWSRYAEVRVSYLRNEGEPLERGGPVIFVMKLRIECKPANKPPIAEFTYSPPNPRVGGFVHFDASGSKDPDGSIVKYEWDLDGDGQTDEEGVEVTHYFVKPGSYTVTLKVTDDRGKTGSTFKILEVSA